MRLSWLPLSHIFARTCDLYTWLVRGSQLGIVENREHIIADCANVHPTLINGVPYFFEKVKQGLIDAGKLGPTEPGGQTHLQKLLGGNMRACCSGGAALPGSRGRILFQEGMPLVQGYGLTESSPVISISTPDALQSRHFGPRAGRRGNSHRRRRRDSHARTARDAWLLERSRQARPK